MADQVRAQGRSYELVPSDGGWSLKLYEDGEEMGGGFGLDEDYDMLLDAAEQFCG